jgi:plasmid maintenance system killer protein
MGVGKTSGRRWLVCVAMIKDGKTEDFFGGENVRQFSGFKKAAERKLVMLDSALKLGDLVRESRK